MLAVHTCSTQVDSPLPQIWILASELHAKERAVCNAAGLRSVRQVETTYVQSRASEIHIQPENETWMNTEAETATQTKIEKKKLERHRERERKKEKDGVEKDVEKE